MKIAVVNAKARGETDRLISEVVGLLRQDNAALAGIVKVRPDPADPPVDCDVEVQVLPNGPVIPITQSLGKGSDACKLDPGAIAAAVSEVEKRPLAGTQLFVLNKFGPEEAGGRGFCAAIAAALEQGIPVLVGVGGASREAFDLFADGLAETLPPDRDAIHAWCVAAMA